MFRIIAVFATFMDYWIVGVSGRDHGFVRRSKYNDLVCLSVYPNIVEICFVLYC